MLSRDIRISSKNSSQFDCYLVLPDGDGKVPAVVLASAVHGVDKDIRALADEFALAILDGLRSKAQPRVAAQAAVTGQYQIS